MEIELLETFAFSGVRKKYKRWCTRIYYLQDASTNSFHYKILSKLSVVKSTTLIL